MEDVQYDYHFIKSGTRYLNSHKIDSGWILGKAVGAFKETDHSGGLWGQEEGLGCVSVGQDEVESSSLRTFKPYL